METGLSLLPRDAFNGDLGDDLALYGEKDAPDDDGGLRTMLELELLKGRRGGFVTAGIGA